MNEASYDALLRTAYGGKPWILASDVLAGMTPLCDKLRALGAESCLCIAASRGTGPAPDEQFAPDPIVLGVQAADMMDAIRRAQDALANVPATVTGRVLAFDPAGTARVLGPIFDDGRPVAGRRKYGARPASWQRLEDKTIIDALWDAAGVTRAPSQVVDASAEPLASASAALDRGLGCVWVGDNLQGFHGGASCLRWVRGPDDVEEAAAFLSAHSRRVRVMPFLEGIPCSIHGMVFPTRTIVFRPCEMLVYRQPGSSRLRYAQAASYWDPPPEDREDMRRIGHSVGEHLRRTVDYRGMYTVDGIMTEQGFVPTELNPRLGAAVNLLTKGLDLPLMLINLAVVEGEPIDWQPEALEHLVVTHADAHRSGRAMVMVERRIEETVKQPLVRGSDGVWTFAPDGVPLDAHATFGPAAMGGIAFVELTPDRTPVGASVAPHLAGALACIDEAWQLGLGTLEPARDVRGEG